MKIKHTVPLVVYNTQSGLSPREAPFRAIDLGEVALRSHPTYRGGGKRKGFFGAILHILDARGYNRLRNFNNSKRFMAIATPLLVEEKRFA